MSGSTMQTNPLQLSEAAVAEARAAIRNGAAAAAPWVRLGLSEAQQAAGMAYDKAGRIVDGSGAVLAEAGSDAARLAQEGKAAAVQGADFAVKQARATVAAGTPYVMRGLSEAQQAAGAAVDEAGNVVNAAGEILAKAGKDAARFAHQGAVAAGVGASHAAKEATALVSAGTPYVMRGLSEAQRAAGLAVNEAGAIVNRAGVVLAPAGEAAAKFAHEGAVQAAMGADIARRYAKMAVSAASPYAAQALTEAQKAAGVMYNAGGQLVNSAGKFVNPAGAVISKAVASAQRDALKAAKIIAPGCRAALTEAQKAAGVAYNAAGYLVNHAGEYVDEAGRAISEGAAQAAHAAALAGPLAAQVSASAVAGVIRGASEAKEALGSAASAAAPVVGDAARAAARGGAAAAAAVGGVAAAGWGETKEAAGAAGSAIAGVAGGAAGNIRDFAGVAGGAIQGAAGDVYNSPALRSIGSAAWSGIDDTYAMSREAIDVAVQLATGVGRQCLDLVKFDIVRDFFQTIGLFFANLASPAMAEAKVVWGNLSNLVSIDFSYSFNTQDILIAMYVVLGILGVLMVVAFIWFVCKADALNPDEDDGDEAKTWDELASEAKNTVKGLRYVMTALMSLYLPISRIVFQILACDPAVVSFAQSVGISSIQEGDCWAWDKYAILFIGALVMLCGFVLFVPLFTYQKIKENIPKGSTLDPDTFFDEDGHPQKYTDAMFNEDVEKDPRQVKCPYQFLYKGYERKWCWYKVIVMVIKLLLCLPIIFLSSHPLAQGLVTLAILAVYSGLSWAASPFISRTSDIMDTSGRVTTLLTVGFGILATNDVAPDSSDTMGVLINITNTLNFILMFLMVITSFGAVKLWLKNKTGTFEAKDTCQNRGGRFKDIVPMWDLNREVKHRVWHPFWNSVLLNKCGDDVAKRLQDLQRICRMEGKKRIKEHYAFLQQPNVARDRAWVQAELEGVDVYWNGVTRDGHNDSKTYFGKMWVKPFPFTCIMVYDDADDTADVIPSLFAQFVQLNKHPDIVAKRQRRQAIRALAGCTVHFPITRIETHSIPDGTETTRDAEGNTVTKQRFANVQVEMRYTSGVVRVKANRNKDMAAGFNASINYNDGVGHARAPHTGQMHEVHGSCSVGHETMGIINSWERTPELDRLLNTPQNRGQWQSRMGGLLQQAKEYRQANIDRRRKQELVLSSDFWLNVYDNFGMSYKSLCKHLFNAEQNPRIRALPKECKKGLDYLYHRTRYVLSHPCCALWFTFWDDVWENNNQLAVLKDKGEDFDPKNSASIAYRPMPREKLEPKLAEKGLTGQKACCGRDKFVTPAALDALYERMDSLNKSSKAASGGNRV